MLLVDAVSKTEIKVGVDGGMLGSSCRFCVVVQPVNDAPRLSGITDIVVDGGEISMTSFNVTVRSELPSGGVGA
ncbi:MAG: hypothetical protein M2R45_00574 [Verrucomicrobia subdivision 3 bacterium]|nr:hypothetical protein [Limisphaerales bacterium]